MLRVRHLYLLSFTFSDISNERDITQTGAYATRKRVLR